MRRTQIINVLWGAFFDEHLSNCLREKNLLIIKAKSHLGPPISVVIPPKYVPVFIVIS